MQAPIEVDNKKNPPNDSILSKRRLDAEAVRDAQLAVGGRLSPEPPVASAVARTGEGYAMFLRLSDLDAVDTHRSVYLPVVQGRGPLDDRRIVVDCAG